MSHPSVVEAINATEEALAAATADLQHEAQHESQHEAVAGAPTQAEIPVAPAPPPPPPLTHQPTHGEARYEVAPPYHEEHVNQVQVATAPPPLGVQPPPSPRGLKRVAEEAIAAASPENIAATREAVAKKKRLCRYPGCTKVIKSQGHCQRHGARAKRCKISGCDKQAQGTHDGMCKRHWKATNFPELASKKGSTPPEPQGESVYDSVLPMSIAYRPTAQSKDGGQCRDMLDPPTAPEGFQTMPLVTYLKEGSLAGKGPGWHRNAERRARGLFPVKGLSIQLEPWERQLALVEILLLSGGTPYANFRDLAYAWGREKGFHHVLANSVCERRGEVERKRRSDAGKSMTDEEKQAFRSKLQKARDKNGTSKKARKLGPGEEVADEATDKVPEHPTVQDHSPPLEEQQAPAVGVPSPWLWRNSASPAEQHHAPAPEEHHQPSGVDHAAEASTATATDSAGPDQSETVEANQPEAVEVSQSETVEPAQAPVPVDGTLHGGTPTEETVEAQETNVQMAPPDSEAHHPGQESAAHHPEQENTAHPAGGEASAPQPPEAALPPGTTITEI